MKKTLVTLFTLVALTIGASASQAACPCSKCIAPSCGCACPVAQPCCPKQSCCPACPVAQPCCNSYNSCNSCCNDNCGCGCGCRKKCSWWKFWENKNCCCKDDCCGCGCGCNSGCGCNNNCGCDCCH